MSERKASPGSMASPLRVIIVDDAEETRKSIQMMMSLVPDSEVIAQGENGREAIALARQYHPDIALIDVNMPVMDGLSAIKVLREEHPDLICIVISAEKDPPTLQRAVAVGAQGYLLKPVTAEQLLSVMERASKVAWAARIQARQPTPQAPPSPAPSLEAQAAQYARERRTDDQALQVFETLAAQPGCNQRWMMTLAMLYIVRKQWSKLKALAARMGEAARATQTAARPLAPQAPISPSVNLETLAVKYAQARRADDQAVKVFETLAEHPNCKQRWLMTLAMLYIVRRQWLPLQTLAARLEQAQRH